MILLILFAFLGFLLVYLEFFFPSGASAIAAAGFLIASLSLSAVRGWPWEWVGAYFLFLIIGLGLTIFAALKDVKKRIALQDDQEGYQAANLESVLIGRKGLVVSDLRPSGHIQIEGRKLPALSTSGYISKGESIKIVALRGAQYIVRKD